MTLVVTMRLYGAVGVGADRLSAATAEQAAPLEVAARAFGVPGVSQVVAFGAITAKLGVLLNLILGLSRVLLAMGRRADMPRVFGRVDEEGPRRGPRC